MSRGPGRWQRLILDSLDAIPPGSGAVITQPDDSPAERSALRRAANRLDADGRIVLVSQLVAGVARLVAYAPGETAPVPRTTTGRDGKTYRRP